MSTTPTPDQAAVLAWLEAAAQLYGADLDTENACSDVEAVDGCDHDDRHGPGVVCLPDGWVCPPCAINWMRWHAGERVSPEVLQAPAETRRAA